MIFNFKIEKPKKLCYVVSFVKCSDVVFFFFLLNIIIYYVEILNFILSKSFLKSAIF